MIHDLTDSQRRLSDFMSVLSEKAWAAGWMDGLEFALWRVVASGPIKYGQLPLTLEHIEQLRRLSAECGGWIVFDDARDEVFVPIATWLPRYTAWLGAQG